MSSDGRGRREEEWREEAEDVGYDTSLYETGAWWYLARCRGEDPAIFFPSDSWHRGQEVAQAKQFCAECPVRAECLEYNLSMIGYDDDDGVYGGLSREERVPLRKARGQRMSRGPKKKWWGAP